MIDDVRVHHLGLLNDALRRPGIYGHDEMAEWLLLETTAAAHDRLDEWKAQYDRLQQSELHSSTGVAGAYRQWLPENAVRSATASAYATIAHRLGWLRLDRTAQLTGVARWAAEDRTETDVVTEFGEPSVRIGGTNPFFPHTLLYAAPGTDPVLFHVWNARPPSSLQGVHPSPVLLVVRHEDGFTFTPEGLRRRP